jgi:hypothetical protein
MTLGREVQGHKLHTGPGSSAVWRIYLTLFTPEAALAQKLLRRPEGFRGQIWQRSSEIAAAGPWQSSQVGGSPRQDGVQANEGHEQLNDHAGLAGRK